MKTRFCVDCNKETLEDLKDYYMVKDFLWKNYGVGKGILCVKCFEKTL